MTGAEAEGKLVGEDIGGFAHDGLGDHHHLLLAARERAGAGRAPLLQFRKCQVSLGHGLVQFAPRQMGPGDAQVFLYRQFAEHAMSFGNGGDAEPTDAMRAKILDFAAVAEDAAARRGQGARQRQDEAAFARAIGAQQRRHAAPLDAQVDAMNHQAAAALDVKFFGGEKTAHAAAPSTTPR